MIYTTAMLCWCVLALMLLDRYDKWWCKRRDEQREFLLDVPL
jgi:hypothetical protein